MKRFIFWLTIVSGLVFLIVWGVAGVKILDHDYDIEREAYIGAACLPLLFGGVLYFRLQRKCPHCGKLRESSGAYCPHCGKKIDQESAS